MIESGGSEMIFIRPEMLDLVSSHQRFKTVTGRYLTPKLIEVSLVGICLFTGQFLQIQIRTKMATNLLEVTRILHTGYTFKIRGRFFDFGYEKIDLVFLIFSPVTGFHSI